MSMEMLHLVLRMHLPLQICCIPVASHAAFLRMLAVPVANDVAMPELKMQEERATSPQIISRVI